MAGAGFWICDSCRFREVNPSKAYLSNKRVHCAHGSIEPTVFKVFGKQLPKAIVFGIGPLVRVVPGELIGCGPAQRRAH